METTIIGRIGFKVCGEGLGLKGLGVRVKVWIFV